MNSNCNAWCIDIDGTLLVNNQQIEGASEFLSYLESTSIPYVIISNTGLRTAQMVSDRLFKIFKFRISINKIFTARDYMSTELETKKQNFSKIMCIPHDPESEFEELHLNTTLENDETNTCIAIFTDGEIHEYYRTLVIVSNYLKRGATLFITSNDSTLVKFDANMKIIVPGPGAFLAALKCMVTNFPYQTFGKESMRACQMNKIMRELHNQNFIGNKRDIIMLGDRFDTDMEFGIANDTQTILVESGCDHANNGHYLQNKIDMIASSIKDIPHTKKLQDTNERIKSFLRQKFRSHLHCLLSSPVAEYSLKDVIHKAENVLLCPPRRIRSEPFNLNEMK